MNANRAGMVRPETYKGSHRAWLPLQRGVGMGHPPGHGMDFPGTAAEDEEYKKVKRLQDEKVDACT